MPFAPPTIRQLQLQRQPELRRKTARERGYSSRWDRYAKWFLSQPQNILCVMCQKEGVKKAAECVDHILEAATHPHLFWDEKNHQPLCLRHNTLKSARR